MRILLTVDPEIPVPPITYGGIDAELLGDELTAAGFADVSVVGWREGSFPGGSIDREQHRSYSLYMEARK